jgi:hypothetical protein
MHDAASGSHPLHRARLEHTLVAVVVLVAHAAVEHVRDGFEATMRMLRESRDVILGLVRAELVEQQEWIEIGQLGLADDPGEFDARAVGGGLAAKRLDDCARGGGELGCGIHGCPKWCQCAANQGFEPLLA